jgi:hypothetical protein
MVRTRLIINVGSTNRTLPNENFKAYERLKKRPSGRSEAVCCDVVKKGVEVAAKKKIQNQKAKRASKMAAS